jgi:hypothetical protein
VSGVLYCVFVYVSDFDCRCMWHEMVHLRTVVVAVLLNRANFRTPITGSGWEVRRQTKGEASAFLAVLLAACSKLF